MTSGHQEELAENGEVTGAGAGRKARKPSTGFSRRRVVSRLWRTAERQVTEIEARLVGASDDGQTLERDAKTLAIITKTIRELVAIDAEATEQVHRNTLREQSLANGPKNGQPGASGVDEAEEDGLGPRDIAGFREELARRLDDLRRERGGSASA